MYFVKIPPLTDRTDRLCTYLRIHCTAAWEFHSVRLHVNLPSAELIHVQHLNLIPSALDALTEQSGAVSPMPAAINIPVFLCKPTLSHQSNFRTSKLEGLKSSGIFVWSLDLFGIL